MLLLAHSGCDSQPLDGFDLDSVSQAVIATGADASAPLAASTTVEPLPTQQLHNLHTATRLGDDRIVVIGGVNAPFASIIPSPHPYAELYVPAGNSFISTGSLAQPRALHTATLLRSGLVLVAGGSRGGTNGTATAELYDPTTGTFTATAAPMGTARQGHSANLLPDGRVVVLGGYALTTHVRTGEIYDPSTNRFTPLPTALVGARQLHTATPLPNGLILIAGGYNGSSLATAELFDPSTGRSQSTGALRQARYLHQATPLPNGQVLITGGVANNNSALNTAEIYNPALGTFRTVSATMTSGRQSHTATGLLNGDVVLIGGSQNTYPSQVPLATVEVFSASSESFSLQQPGLQRARLRHSATLLADGRILVIGGQNASSVVRDAEFVEAACPNWYRDADGDGYGDPATVTNSCAQPTGYVANNADCNDTDPAIHPDTVWYRDADGDRYGAANLTTRSCTQPSGYVRDNTDCNDTDSAINPQTVWHLDSDGDTYGTIATTTTACTQPNGYVRNNTDCDDGAASVHPGATEVCEPAGDQIDNNCNGDLNDASAPTTWYRDSDGDTYGAAAVTTNSCTQPDGYVANNTDCNDAAANVHPGAAEACEPAGSPQIDNNCNGDLNDAGELLTWYRDGDGDGYGDPAVTSSSCTPPTGYVSDKTDCNDTDATINPNTTWYRDADGDTYGTPDLNTRACAQPDGYVRDQTDCNDADATINPNTLWYRDSDGDAYGAAAVTTNSCTQPSGYVRNNTDCDDAAANVHPGAPEVCEPAGGAQIDNNCNGDLNDASAPTTWYRDSDGDTYGAAAVTTNSCTQPDGYVANNTDCDDAAAGVHPGAPEVCEPAGGAQIDNNCNGDLNDASQLTIWYRDSDGDGHGDVAVTSNSCSQPSGYVSNKTDCNDTDGNVYPDAPERCESTGAQIDNDCDGNVDDAEDVRTWYRDNDGDTYGDPAVTSASCTQPSGYVSTNTDCNDADPTLHPATLWYRDADADLYGDPALSTTSCTEPTGGYVRNNTDCNDAAASVHPGAPEVCEPAGGAQIDNNCNGDLNDALDVTTWYADADSDTYGDPAVQQTSCTQPAGHVGNGNDCNDADGNIHPGAPEVCETGGTPQIDNDCDGNVNDAANPVTWYRDADADGYGDTAGSTTSCSQPAGYVRDNTDCDDTDAAVHPGQTYCADFDADGFGTANPAYRIQSCRRPDGYSPRCDDCNDADRSVNPDNRWYLDSDSDGFGDPDLALSITSCTPPTGYVTNNSDCDDHDRTFGNGRTWYRDQDQDSYGNPQDTRFTCLAPNGYIARTGDCNDTDGAIRPTAAETCDQIDNNCDGRVDEGVQTAYCADFDRDGFGTTDTNYRLNACSQPPGYSSRCDDCNDADATINSDTRWCRDSDGDRFGNPAVSQSSCSQPAGYIRDCNDCNDADAAFNTSNAVWYADADHDGHGSASVTTTSCAPPAGYIKSPADDCNDADATAYPGAPELCDGVDHNCDGVNTNTVWYRDADGDGFGVAGTTTRACLAPTGYVATSTDCDDTKADVYPGATELCEPSGAAQVDNNCNGNVNDAANLATWYADLDHDGHGGRQTMFACAQPSGYVASGDDCNDSNPAVVPGATEVCDAIDNNCDGQTDEGVQIPYCADFDGDGYGSTNPAFSRMGCAGTMPDGYSTSCNDCNDGDARIHPQTVWHLDFDRDTFGDPSTTVTACSTPAGYVLDGTDCNDHAANVNPRAAEVCEAAGAEQVDNNCDGSLNGGAVNLFTWYLDRDRDTYGSDDRAEQTASCNDPSTCNNTGCNGPLDVKYVLRGGDCRDDLANVNPGRTEVCEPVPERIVASCTDCGADETCIEGAGQTICIAQIDTDCDGRLNNIDPRDTSAPLYWGDADNDGAGTNSFTVRSCIPPRFRADITGTYVRAPSDEPAAVIPGNCQRNYAECDCNDQSGGVYPRTPYTLNGAAAPEICNGYDDNCSRNRCNDNNADPTDDCDKQIDEGIATLMWYRDLDGDGCGAPNTLVVQCGAPGTGCGGGAWVNNALDQNDGLPDCTPPPGLSNSIPLPMFTSASPWAPWALSSTATDPGVYSVYSVEQSYRLSNAASAAQ